MKKSNFIFNSKRIASDNKKKSRNDAWKKKLGGKKKRSERLRLDFVKR